MSEPFLATGSRRGLADGPARHAHGHRAGEARRTGRLPARSRGPTRSSGTPGGRTSPPRTSSSPRARRSSPGRRRDDGVTRRDAAARAGRRCSSARGPCDAHALEVMDRLFLDDPVDLYYAERRAQDDARRLRLRRRPVGGLLLHDGRRRAGRAQAPRRPPRARSTAATPSTSSATRAARSSPRRKLEAAATDACEAAAGGRGPAARWPRRGLARAASTTRYWAELAERCLGCRTCTYDCPVCYCFDVRDRRLADGAIERLRCWDSCQGASCFAIAGGHNPRPTQAQRVRQRYMHKFLYYPTREGGGALRRLRPLRRPVPGQHRHPRGPRPRRGGPR